MDTLEAKEKLSFNLLHPESKAFNITILFIVYKTIDRNKAITLNQLKWLLNSEYMLANTLVEGAVASLTSKSLFNCVSRWQPPRNTDTVHLRPRPANEFSKWLEQNLKDYPELAIFNPPEFVPAQARNAPTKPQQ